jgi:uncharacterized membrane protein
MKNFALILLAALCFASCGKDDGPTLEGTSWKYVYEMSNKTITLELNLTSGTHGHATIHENTAIPGTQPFYITHVYDVCYTFDGIESGNITFIKESVDVSGTQQTYFNWYTDTVNTSYYTYAGNNKMFVYTTPNSLLKQIDLTRQ